MTYKEWILRHVGKDTPLGDLANDISSDKCFPDTSSKSEILDHLTGVQHHACSAAIDIFNRSWSSYRAYVRTHKE